MFAPPCNILYISNHYYSRYHCVCHTVTFMVIINVMIITYYSRYHCHSQFYSSFQYHRRVTLQYYTFSYLHRWCLQTISPTTKSTRYDSFCFSEFRHFKLAKSSHKKKYKLIKERFCTNKIYFLSLKLKGEPAISKLLVLDE